VTDNMKVVSARYIPD